MPFGILEKRFRFLQTYAEISPDVMKDLVLAACSLHNFLRHSRSATQVYMRTGDVDSENSVTHVVNEGAWRLDGPMGNVTNISKQLGSGTRHPQDAKEMRQALRDYFNSSAGAAAWQENMISKTK